MKIINQRKAFLDMLASWSEGTDNGRQKTRNHGYDVIVGGELFTDYSDHPRKLVTLNPKLKSTGAGRYQPFPLVGCLPQAAWPELSKSQDAVALQQIKERGALPMIDRGDIRQAIDRCSNIWASLPGAGYGQFEHKADSLIAKFKEAGGTVREIDVCEQVTRYASYPSSSACHGLLIITVITPCHKTARQKCQRTEAQRTRQLLTCRCVSVMLLRSIKPHEGLLMLKLKMMLCVMMLPLVVVGCTSKQSVSQCVKPPPPPAWIMQPPPDWQTPLNGIISPSEG